VSLTKGALLLWQSAGRQANLTLIMELSPSGEPHSGNQTASTSGKVHRDRVSTAR